MKDTRVVHLTSSKMASIVAQYIGHRVADGTFCKIDILPPTDPDSDEFDLHITWYDDSDGPSPGFDTIAGILAQIDPEDGDGDPERG